MIAVNVGKQYQIRLRQRAQFSLSRVHVDYLSSRLNHHGGVLNGRDLDGSRSGFEFFWCRGKRVFPPTGIDRRFALGKVTPYPTGVVGLHYKRAA